MSANPRIATQRASEPAAPHRDAERTPLSPLGRLKALHSEARETARLANLLGRSLYIAIALPLGAAATLDLADRGLAPELSWAALVLVAAAVLFRAYRHTMAAPFERAALRAFADDLKAILLYAGFAWGAGAFLALTGSTDPIVTVLFATIMCAGVTALLRSADMALHFTAPVAVLTAAATVLRPLAGGAVVGVAVLAGCGLVALVAIYLERRGNGRPEVPELADPSLA